MKQMWRRFLQIYKLYRAHDFGKNVFSSINKNFLKLHHIYSHVQVASPDINNWSWCGQSWRSSKTNLIRQNLLNYSTVNLARASAFFNFEKVWWQQTDEDCSWLNLLKVSSNELIALILIRLNFVAALFGQISIFCMIYTWSTGVIISQLHLL